MEGLKYQMEPVVNTGSKNEKGSQKMAALSGRWLGAGLSQWVAFLVATALRTLFACALQDGGCVILFQGSVVVVSSGKTL